MRPFRPFVFAALAGLALGVAGCDSGFGGSPSDNRVPETELSVRSIDLRDDLGDRRLVSTVDLAWSGVDPDGVVAAYDVRAYVVGGTLPMPGPDEGWARTARRDSTILLPIPEGNRTADVAVEVRAVDNDGSVDPTPARTVFPIINSDPTFRLTAAEAPADTTWPVLSFAFAGADPDGAANLAGVEIALNDTTAWTRLAPDVTFVTLVAEDPSATGTTGARVFVGRGFQNASLTVPGLRLGADNVVYFRAVDAAGGTSRTTVFPDPDADRAFYVRRVTSPILVVNDVRPSVPPPGQPVIRDLRPLALAREALALHGATGYDVWDLSFTPLSVATPRTSEALPVATDPTLRQTLALWSRIFWVSSAVTNAVTGNNLPLAATVTSTFFDRGGKMLVQTPVTRPLAGDSGESNAAIDLLPMTGLVDFGTTVRNLRASSGTPVRPAQTLPNGATLPPLAAAAFITTALPYEIGPDDVPLYRMSFSATLADQSQAPWTGSEVVASIGADGRVGLFALPLFSGAGPLFGPATPGGPGVADALAAMLSGLDFPTGGRLPARRLASRR